MSGNITVIPGEISKFKNSKAKPFNEKQIVKLLKEAFPVNPEDMEDSDDDEDEKPRKASKKKKAKELTIEDKLNDLDEDELKEVALSLGLSKKEIKNMDEEEIIDTIVSDYDEDDIQEILDDMDTDEDDED